MRLTGGFGDMKKWLYDFILGAVVLLLSIAALVYSGTLKDTQITLFLARPDVYMALWLGALALLAVLLMARALRRRKTEEGQERRTPIWTSLPIVTAAVLFVYLLVLDKLGFVLDSVAMLWTLTFLYSMNSGEEGKNWRDKKTVAKELEKSGIFAVVCVVVVYYVFTGILSVRLPVFSLF